MLLIVSELRTRPVSTMEYLIKLSQANTTMLLLLLLLLPSL
jgi:hypothetical protein